LEVLRVLYHGDREACASPSSEQLGRGEQGGARRAAALDRDGGPKLILISTLPVDFADLIAASPVLGFIAKSELSASAIQDLLAGDDARSALL